MVLEITLPGHEHDGALNDMLGLRIVLRGKTEKRRTKRRRVRRGGFDYVAMENAELTALAAARIRQRRENRERNERAMG